MNGGTYKHHYIAKNAATRSETVGKRLTKSNLPNVVISCNDIFLFFGPPFYTFAVNCV